MSSISDPPVKVSVITVVYNGVETIEKTILSVINQSYQNFEYIIIDGGSKDGTLNVIEKYKDQISYWVSEPDNGIYDAMNKGITMASGEWIHFLNCGDRYFSNDVLAIFDKHRFNEDIVYGDAIIEYPSFKTIYPKAPLKKIWKTMPFCHQAAFVRTDLMKQYNFDLKYKLSADYDFLYKAYLFDKKFLLIEEMICLFDFKGGASKGNRIKSVQERMRSSLEKKFSIWRHLYYFCLISYIKISSIFRSMASKNMTEWVTRLLRA